MRTLLLLAILILCSYDGYYKYRNLQDIAEIQKFDKNVVLCHNQGKIIIVEPTWYACVLVPKEGFKS